MQRWHLLRPLEGPLLRAILVLSQLLVDEITYDLIFEPPCGWGDDDSRRQYEGLVVEVVASLRLIPATLDTNKPLIGALTVLKWLLASVFACALVAIAVVVSVAIKAPGEREQEPGPFVDTITIEGGAFDYTEITLPSGVEFTMILNNQDDGVAHNVIFMGFSHGHAWIPDGCTTGCADGSPELRTELTAGPVQQTFTFTTPPPGEYLFWCDVYPDTMIGVLVVTE